MSFSIDDHVVGVDLGGSNLRACLLDGAGAALAELAEPTDGADARAVVAQLGEIGRRLAGEAGVGWDAIVGVGVGVPGVVVHGALAMAPNLPSFAGIDLSSALSDELDAEVVVDNDVNMATVGEHRHGVGAHVDDFVFIAVGTGVGMGVVAGGRLLHGARGAAGEIGEVPLDGAGALEDVAGGIAVARSYRERVGGADGLTAHDVYEAAARGDEAATDVLDRQARALAHAVAAVRGVLDPAAIVFGGGIGSRDDFLPRLRPHLARLGHDDMRIERSALGARAGVVGAAEVARGLARSRKEQANA
jgi:glucokinase